MRTKLLAACLGLGVLAFAGIFIWGAARPLDPVQSRGGAGQPTASTAEAFSDGRIDIEIYVLGNRDIRLEVKFIPEADVSEADAVQPHVNFAMVGMHMDGFTPSLERAGAGAWGANLKLPMAGRWIASVGFGEEFAEVEFDAP